MLIWGNVEIEKRAKNIALIPLPINKHYGINTGIYIHVYNFKQNWKMGIILFFAFNVIL